MIIEYFRPQTLSEALHLLGEPNTRPLGGGTLLNRRSPDPVRAVDLQALNLARISTSGKNLEIGAMTTLESLLSSDLMPKALNTALRLEAPLNLRNMGTIAGTLVGCNGRSAFATAMLALDTTCLLASLGGPSEVSLGDLLPLRKDLLTGKLITTLRFSLTSRMSFNSVSRTPSDLPIVSAALVQWESGRTRLALGGWGHAPCLVLDGKDTAGIAEAARNTASEATDEWASAEYRSEIAGILSSRCLEELGSK
jgi:CO/xanthine dehydrogenase FAD-binding subunit